MSHVPTVLKSDRSVFDKMLPVNDNGEADLRVQCLRVGQRGQKLVLYIMRTVSPLAGGICATLK